MLPYVAAEKIESGACPDCLRYSCDCGEDAPETREVLTVNIAGREIEVSIDKQDAVHEKSTGRYLGTYMQKFDWGTATLGGMVLIRHGVEFPIRVSEAV